MTENNLIKKLLIKSDYRLCVLNAPDGYLSALEPLPEGSEYLEQLEGSFDMVQLFVKTRAELEAQIAGVLKALKPAGLLWIVYPKISSKMKSDLTRDNGWGSLKALGWEVVSLIAIDQTWSAMRFRPVNEIKFKPGSQRQVRASETTQLGN